MDCRGRDRGLACGDSDLIEALDNVAGAINAIQCGHLVLIGRKTAHLGDAGPDRANEAGIGRRAERRVQGVELIFALRPVDHRHNLVPDDLDRPDRTIHDFDAGRCELPPLGCVKVDLSGRQKRYIFAVVADEKRLCRTVTICAKNGDALIHRFESVADGAISHKTPRDGFAMDSFVHRRNVIDYTCCQQDCPCRLHLATEHHVITCFRWPYGIDAGSDAGNTVQLRVLSHPVQQFRARDPVGEGRLVVRCRNPAGPALAGVENEDGSPVAREIKSGCQSGRPPTDDHAIENAPSPTAYAVFFHRKFTRLRRSAFITTVKDDRAIAAPANIGDIKRPKAG